MKYSEFRDRAFVEIIKYLPEEYSGYTVKLESIPKVNHTKECLHIRPDDQTSVVPNLYVDDMYNMYMKGNSFEETMRMAAEYYVAGLEMGKQFSMEMDQAIHEKNIVFQLVNTNRNIGMIKDKPHRSWLNLTIIYRAVISCPDNGFYSAVITEEIARDHGWTEDELYEFAVKNTPELMPLSVLEVTEAFNIMTNEHKTMGAGVVLYEKALAEQAEEYDDDLYLIPSSIHEMLVLPACSNERDELVSILRDCNCKVLDVHDILSDSIYFYEKKTGMISIA